jgi:hypothetical protein
MDTALLELTEEPGLRIPLAPWAELVDAGGYHLLLSTSTASVERIRLEADGVPEAVVAVRALARERELEHVTWWVGELSRPAELASQLLALGLVPDPEQPELTSLRLERPPAGEDAVEVRRVETIEDYLVALELDWEVWDVPEQERAARRKAQSAAWPELARSERSSHFLAVVDGRPAGFGRLIHTPAAAILMGGSTLPWARGRGVYTSLVHARWRETAGRGVPRLVTGAGAMSAPILERLGFARMGGIRLLRDIPE